MTNIQVLHSSESNEWYTPSRYLTLVRRVLGNIELDPASCEIANRAVCAERIFTPETDGLLQSWEAESLFLNPPYGKTDNDSNAGIWAAKLISEYESKRTKQAILLVNACTSEAWFQPLYLFPICFTDHRIKFVPPPERAKKNQPTKGNCFVYFGDNLDLFVSVFSEVGSVVSLLTSNQRSDGGLTAPPKSLRIPLPVKTGKSPARI